jgi:hypothetical protein
MKVFHSIADRMLALLVPATTAHAAPCACDAPYGTTLGYTYCSCTNHTLRYKRRWCDGCNIKYDACKTVDFC